MSRNWQVVPVRGSTGATLAADGVRYTATGRFSIARALWTALGAPPTVGFLWDPTTPTLGLTAVRPSQAAFQVAVPPAPRRVSVMARGVLRYCGRADLAVGAYAARVVDGVLE